MGIGELTIVLLIVVVLFGAKKLPQLGEGVGKAIRGLKRGLRNEDFDDEIAEPASAPAAIAADSAEGTARVSDVVTPIDAASVPRRERDAAG